MILKRSSGILLHPTSLPGSPGIGTLGKQAFLFVDWLEKAGQSLWQVLPLGPTGYGDSPYASFSTFAGNPLLIDIDSLVEQGFLSAQEASPPDYIVSAGNVDFGSVVYWKIPLLKKAAHTFLTRSNEKYTKTYTDFKNKQHFWLDDYALFMSIKEYYDAQAQKEGLFGKLWNNYWPKALALREKAALADWQKSHKTDIEIQKAVQFFFFYQWEKLKNYANAKGVSIIGDIPIFVALDSADVWANQHLFQLNKKALPKAVAGVPPDYFSETGQLWGNPLYDWKTLKAENYFWWIERIRHSLTITDYVRIDHFRGFEAYWSVPYGEKTAVNGKWVKGPGADLFNAVQKKLGTTALIAEDLGVITDGVRKLLAEFNFPGMKVLQFAFDIRESEGTGCTNAFLPHMYDKNCVVYTGTHDNDTTQGWLNNCSDEERRFISEYVSGCVNDVHLQNHQLCSALISAAFFSTAAFALIPLQDLFSFGSEMRMNTPSTSGGSNWTWRMDDALLGNKDTALSEKDGQSGEYSQEAGTHIGNEKAAWLKRLSELSGRNIRQSV
ncbi:4-alpha-glucanotransferase [Treponema sp. OMZ 840]|uniref:4-alpha-glucanotransferase n=1 Tax=Treponema sp. OMZ 840 TaxID=244313 RepID=UPI003D8F2EA5